MLKNLKKLILAVLLFAIVLNVSACNSKKSEIKKLTERFENACNKVDLNEMLDCIDPAVSKSVKAVTGFIGMFSEDDTDELLEKFGGVLFEGMPENSREFFESIKITLGDIEAEENSAAALAEIEYEISGEDHKTNAKFEYTYDDEKWYISNLDIE